MQLGYLIMEVDENEVLPKGVYAHAHEAVDGYAEEQGMDEDSTDRLLRAFREAERELGHVPAVGFEVRFEHPDMSIDIQVTAVEVYL
jgi:hypothetical protein